MRVIQLIETLAAGDGMGNHAIQTHKALKEAGYEIVTYSVNLRLPVSDDFQQYTDELDVMPEDIIIYQFGIYGQIADKIQSFPCRKILVYHNITPSNFFVGYDISSFLLTKKAEEKIALWGKQDFFDSILSVSRFNAECLIDVGFPSYKITVMGGCLMPMLDEGNSLNPKNKKRNDGYTNILFVGRIAPNKKQTDIIEAFAYYQKHFNPLSRLILIGGGLESKYGETVLKYAEDLHCSNIVFKGFASDTDLKEQYRNADVFLCMSEHEGFCIPLVEAMKNGVPVIAFSAGAVPDTLGDAGVLLQEKNAALAAMWINKIATDEKMKEKLIQAGYERLKAFDQKQAREQFINYFKEFIDEKVLKYKTIRDDGVIAEIEPEIKNDGRLYDYLTEKFQCLGKSMPIDRNTYVDMLNGRSAGR